MLEHVHKDYERCPTKSSSNITLRGDVRVVKVHDSIVCINASVGEKRSIKKGNMNSCEESRFHIIGL